MKWASRLASLALPQIHMPYVISNLAPYPRLASSLTQISTLFFEIQLVNLNPLSAIFCGQDLSIQDFSWIPPDRRFVTSLNPII
jgi:hypothetical protein